MVGMPVTMPVGVAPTGLTGMTWPNGEIIVMKACEAFGIPYTLSTVSIASIEDLAAVATRPFWFQLYVIRDRDFTERLLRRAESAGVTTLVLTLDLQMVGQRNKDIHNGLSSPPKPTLRNLANLAGKPAWCAAMLKVRKMQFGNLYGHVDAVTNTTSLAEWTNAQFDPSLDWDDVRRLRDRWKGKLVLKGLNDPEDAVIAAGTGADALVDLEPWRPPARWRAVDHRRAAGDRRGGRREDRAPDRRRLHLGPGCVQGAGARGEGRDDRPGHAVWPRAPRPAQA